MKAQSFEYELLSAEPPPPSPEARLQARRAAVAEFERIRARSEFPRSPLRSSRKRRSWWSNNVVLGGLATACIALIVVSVVSRVPVDQRNIRPAVRLPVDVPTEPAATTGSPPTSESATPAELPVLPEPATSTHAESGRPGQPPTQPSGELSAPAAIVGREAQTSSLAKLDDASPQTSQSTLPIPAPDFSAPLQVVPDSSGRPEQSAPSQLEEIITPAKQREATAPSTESTPAITRQSGGDASVGLEEIAVSANKSSGPGSLFARKYARKKPESVARPNIVESRDTFQHFDINAVKRVADDPVSTVSVDVDTASYSFVRRKLQQGQRPPADAVRVEEMVNYFDYAWPAPESRDPPFQPTVTVSDSPWTEGNKLVHVAIRGYELPVREQPDVNLVLLLDVSGSMDSPDKLPLAQQSMALLLDSLKPTDTVAIVAYAGAAGEVLAPTQVKRKAAILEALNSLEPGGSTAGSTGIRLAYELAERNLRRSGVNRILLATDGDFNVGITDEGELLRFVEQYRQKGVFLSVLGFGEGNYRDDMAQILAQNGNGVAAYIDSLSEARRVLVQQATGSVFTIAKDVKLQVEFNPATVAEYRLVGYETRALNREDFNNDKVDAGDVGSGHTVTAIYEITPVDSKSKLVDESRYATQATPPVAQGGKVNEYGFLKIRYKTPNGLRSRLLERPILIDAGVPAKLRQDVEFSTAVAGFGQLLRGGRYTGSLGYEDVLRQAQSALGEDRDGRRAEFVQLVREAQEAR